MFSSEEEYLQATRDAQVNTYAKRREGRRLFLFTNMFLLLGLLIVSFLYFTKANNYLSENLFGKKTVVLGASHRSTESEEYSDAELMVVLNNTETETLTEHSKTDEQALLADEMNELLNESAMQNQTSYEHAISKELEETNEESIKGRIVLVKKGDTLSSLAKKYYGDSMAFHEIIANNKNISEESPTLYVGQKIHIPY